MEQTKENMQKIIKKNSFVIVLFMAFTISIFAPLNLYMTNKTEFWFDIYQIFPLLLICFIAFCVCGVALILVLSRVCPCLLKYGNIVVFTLTLCAYIQGNYFIYDYMVLDGTPIAWNKHMLDSFCSIVFWIMMLGTMLVIGCRKKIQYKFQSFIKIVSICIFLVEVVALVVTGITTKGFKKKDGRLLTRKNEFVYSADKNFTIVILDSFDSREFTKLLNEDNDFQKIFKDFTYYPDTVTRFDFTDYSIPQIMTGQEYGGEDYQEYMQSAFTSSPLFNRLKLDGWSTNVYLDLEIPPNSSRDIFDNYQDTKLRISSRRRMISYIYKLVGFQYLPYQLKQYCWYYPDEINDLRYIKSIDGKTEYDSNEGEAYYWSNNNFNEEMSEVIGNAKEDMCHIYHLRGIHTPRYYDRDFNCVGSEVGLDESGIGVVKMLNRYLTLLKDSKVYDNNVIVIMADHGTPDVENGIYKHNPLLMIKGMGERHDMNISEVPLSYSDLQKIFDNLLNKKQSVDSVKKANEPRKFYVMDSNDDALNGRIKKSFREYSVNGNAQKVENVKATGYVFNEK